jgi:hypothetical protein
MLEARALGDQAQVIEGVAEPVALPAPSRKPRRKVRVRPGCESWCGHSRRKRKFLTEITGWTRRAPRRARPTPPVL